MSVHSTAIIHPTARLGANLQIDAYVVVGPDVIAGDRCHFMSHCTIEHTELGPDCRVFPQASLGLEPQHLGYKGEKTKLVAGARNVFREGVTVHRGSMFDKGVTSIGNDNYFMALSHIAHDCRIGNNVILANAAQLAGHVEVADRCFISTTVGIHQFGRIGTLALVSGGAMVSLDVAPYCIAQGDRAVLKGLNIIGMKRAGFSRDDIRLIKNAYKAVFLSELALCDALKDSALWVDNEKVKTFRQFLETPKRGFARPNLLKAKRQEEEVEA